MSEPVGPITASLICELSQEIAELKAEVARWKERIDAGVHPNTVDLIALEQTKAES